ncbi:MAG: hypothetical protein IJU56_06010 [Clostridia bacterium]|nr:hypothetical protein [Clostridia bacterium]
MFKALMAVIVVVVVFAVIVCFLAFCVLCTMTAVEIIRQNQPKHKTLNKTKTSDKPVDF